MKGGPIGLKLTGTLAQVFMIWWDDMFRQKLRNIGIDTVLYKRYVDDINMCAFEIETGTKFEGDCLVKTGEDDGLEVDANLSS